MHRGKVLTSDSFHTEGYVERINELFPAFIIGDRAGLSAKSRLTLGCLTLARGETRIASNLVRNFPMANECPLRVLAV